MRRSKYPKWFNPTGYAHWDEYYEVVWILLAPIALAPIGILIAATINTLRP